MSFKVHCGAVIRNLLIWFWHGPRCEILFYHLDFYRGKYI